MDLRPRPSILLLSSALLAACSAAPLAPANRAADADADAEPIAFAPAPAIISQAGPPPTAAQQPPPVAAEPAGGFSFVIEPYFWIVGSEGNANLGNKGQVHASFGDMFDSMDPAFGVRGDMGPESGPYRILFDTNYQSISKDTRSGSFHAYHSMFEGDVAWRPGAKDYFSPLLGLRYTELDAIATFDVSNTASGSYRGFLDPIVGARGQIPLVDRLAVHWRADVGGFGVGSDLSVQLDASASWTINRMFRAFVGWRYLKVDYSSSDLDYNVAATGPYAGMSFVF
jgi:hypothetical protein